MEEYAWHRPKVWFTIVEITKRNTPKIILHSKLSGWTPCNCLTSIKLKFLKVNPAFYSEKKIVKLTKSYIHKLFLTSFSQCGSLTVFLISTNQILREIIFLGLQKCQKLPFWHFWFFFSSNQHQLFSYLFSKTVNFTEFLPKTHEREFP